MPKRISEETVNLSKCQPGYACLDQENFKRMIKNKINTEAYIKEIENLLNTLADPIKGTP